MKMLNIAMILVVIWLAIGLFDNTITMDGSMAVPDAYNSSSTSVDGTSNMLLDFAMNPSTWTNSSLLIFLLVTVIATVGTISIAAGVFKYQASDTVLFSAAFGVLVGMGSIPVWQLYNLLNREIGAFACSPGVFCAPSAMFGALVVAPLALGWVFVCLKWWRTGVTE